MVSYGCSSSTLEILGYSMPLWSSVNIELKDPSEMCADWGPPFFPSYALADRGPLG